jgi:hypothetical protein
MRKVTYQKANNGLMVFEIAGYIFCIHPDFLVPVSALNDDAIIFNPESIVAVDGDCLIIAQ